MTRLKDKVALITGGSQGMGANHAKLFIREGAHVIIGDINEEKGQELAKSLGKHATFVQLDVTNQSHWSNAVNTAVTKYEGLDIVVNNAGIIHSAPIEEQTLDQWRQTLDINLTGVFLGIKESVPELKKSVKNPTIINISSTAGIQGYANGSSYCASKFGLRGLTKATALDLAKYNIRVNSVHPGSIETPMVKQSSNKSMKHQAMNRHGLADEISHLVLFLASDESTFITGTELIADGGETTGLAANFYES